jgi:phosphatidylinositol alpha-mannosyltransferase
MRILQTCPYDWDAPGGVQVHVRQLARQLRRRGHELLVLAPGRGLASPDPVCVVGRPIPVPYNGSVAPICPSRASARRVAEVLDRFRPDVVHVHEPLTPSTSMFAALRSEAPVVATFHAYVPRSTLIRAASPLLRRVWRRLDVRLGVSHAVASFVSARMGGGEAVQVVANGADLEPFENAAPAALPVGRKLLFVSRLEPRKGFAVLLEAFEALDRRMTDVILIVAGDGGERDAVNRLAPRLRQRVIMLGAMRHERLPPIYSAANLFIGPATGRESFGIVLLEAMAAGLPIVASDIPGYREVVRDGVDGLLVRPADPNALARAAASVLDDHVLARQLAAASRARVRAFTWDRVIGRLEGFYDEAVRRPRRRDLVRADRRIGLAVPSIVTPPDWT